MVQLNLLLIFSIAIVSVAYLVSYSDACFITNCPPGGKRSMLTALSATNRFHRECTRCGPALSGRCFGPNICCSPLLGCLVGGPIATRCQLEAYSTQLCTNPGQSCGSDGKGVCALNATCCTADGCFADKNCIVGEQSSQPEMSTL